MVTAQLISFLSAALLLSIMPGPDNMYVLTESVLSGKKQGVALSAGFASGVMVHTLLAATGVGFFIQQSSTLVHIIKWIGFAYLLYLAWQAYQSEQALDIAASSSTNSIGASYRRAFLMNVLNPKVTLFFLIFLPQFVRPDAWAPFWQIIFLGILFMIQAFIVFSTIALLADRLRPFVLNGNMGKRITWIKVLVLVGLAIFIIL